MKNIFDYTYYRIAKSYYKRDGSDTITALLTITLIVFLYLSCLLVLIQGFIFKNFRTNGLSYIEKGLIVLVLYAIYLVVKRVYKGRYFELRKRWINESIGKKRINGALVVFFILSPLVLFVIIAHYFGRTNF